jgi:hypothetical protein
MAESDVISVAAFIEELRQELTYAIATDRDHQLRFDLGPVEVELSVAVSRRADGAGGVGLWVIPVGGEQKSPSAHKITLNLTPAMATGTPVDSVADLADLEIDRPAIIQRDQLPQSLIARYAEDPMDYR